LALPKTGRAYQATQLVPYDGTVKSPARKCRVGEGKDRVPKGTPQGDIRPITPPAARHTSNPSQGPASQLLVQRHMHETQRYTQCNTTHKEQ